MSNSPGQDKSVRVLIKPFSNSSGVLLQRVCVIFTEWSVLLPGFIPTLGILPGCISPVLFDQNDVKFNFPAL